MNLNNFKGFEYEAQDADTEILLSEIPLHLLMDSIKEQFDKPFEYMHTDYLQSFITKWIITKENMTTDEVDDMQELYRQFISFMENMLYERLGIGLPEIDDMGEDDQLELLHMIYRYFIMNIKQNFTNFISTYITSHKEELVDIIGERQDVTRAAFKDVVIDPLDLAIITSLEKVIWLVLNNDELTVDTFLKLSHDNDSDLENEYITEKYDSNEVNGNFVASYTAMVSGDTLIEIECQVRNQILSSYRKEESESGE